VAVTGQSECLCAVRTFALKLLLIQLAHIFALRQSNGSGSQNHSEVDKASHIVTLAQLTLAIQPWPLRLPDHLLFLMSLVPSSRTSMRRR
jgi:hypothetical protein